MAQLNNVLEFSGKPQGVTVAIDQLKARLELAHRGGCFGLMGLFSKSLPKDTLLKLDTAKQIVAQLSADMSANAIMSGKLDLSGYRKPEKKKREGKSRTGRLKLYYRDYWFTCRMRTADGCQLRLAVAEDVKEKKASVFRKLRVGVKIIPNTSVYTVKQPDQDIVRRAFPLKVTEMMAKPEGISLTAGAGSREPKASEVLRVVRAAYDSLVLNRVAGIQRIASIL